MYFKQMEDFVKLKNCWIQGYEYVFSMLFRDQLIWNWYGKRTVM